MLALAVLWYAGMLLLAPPARDAEPGAAPVQAAWRRLPWPQDSGRGEPTAISATPGDAVPAACGLTSWQDSVRTLLGVDLPTGGLHRLDVPRVAWQRAAYDVSTDAIEVRLDGLPCWAARTALAHEYAHLWQARHGGDLAELWRAWRVPAPPDGSYAGTGVEEHAAEAMAYGLAWYSVAASAPPGAAATLLGQLEADVPGTRQMAQVIARHALPPAHGLPPHYVRQINLLALRYAPSWLGTPLAGWASWETRQARPGARLGWGTD